MSHSNTKTGEAPADPYVQVNSDQSVSGPQKMKDFTEFITSTKFGMLTTHQAASASTSTTSSSCTGRLVSRSMALAATETNGIDLVFVINTESGKTSDIAADADCNVSFFDASSKSWASVAGRAVVVTDRDEVGRHYTPAVRAWLGDLGDGLHDGSERDPRVGLLKLRTETVTYNLGESGAVKTAVKVAHAAVKGKPPTVGNLRHISEEEIKAWRAL